MRSQFLGTCFLGRFCWRMRGGSKAEFERDLMRERTHAGVVAARARGRIGGQPKKLKTNGKVALARRMCAEQSHSMPEMCAALGISRAPLSRYVKETTSPEYLYRFHQLNGS